jgi:hypothetical protein
MLETGGGRRPGDALMLLYFHFKVNKYMRHEMHCNKYKHMICQFNLHFKEKRAGKGVRSLLSNLPRVVAFQSIMLSVFDRRAAQGRRISHKYFLPALYFGWLQPTTPQSPNRIGKLEPIGRRPNEEERGEGSEFGGHTSIPKIRPVDGRQIFCCRTPSTGQIFPTRGLIVM